MVQRFGKHELYGVWKELLHVLETTLGKKPKDLNAILFLIGVQEAGFGKKDYTKEEKEDLMHVALCKLLSYSGYYQFEYFDAEGWPHYKLIRPIPYKNIVEQVTFMREHIIHYFKDIGVFVY